MCFFSKLTSGISEVESRFNAKAEIGMSFQPKQMINGFEHPSTPVVCNEQRRNIQMFQWGLVPNWAKDKSIRKYTLNAAVETISEKPSFKYSITKRCLVIANGFYEWQWQDSKGKEKRKFLLQHPAEALFAFGGLWAENRNQHNGEILYSYTIVTAPANELMSRIHNSKKRMPLLLRAQDEKLWLEGEALDYFSKRVPDLQAIPQDGMTELFGRNYGL